MKVTGNQPQNQITKQPTTEPIDQTTSQLTNHPTKLVSKIVGCLLPGSGSALGWGQQLSSSKEQLQTPERTSLQRHRTTKVPFLSLLLNLGAYKYNSQNPSCICQQRHRFFKVSSNLPINLLSKIQDPLDDPNKNHHCHLWSLDIPLEQCHKYDQIKARGALSLTPS